MKVLMVDKYYFIKGGAERYFFELKKILEARGHQVVPFSMQHELNFPSEWSDYFVPNVEFNGLGGLQKLTQGPAIAARVIYSRKARELIRRLIDRVKPDIAHLHMIDHQISPSILFELKAHGIPVIQTCHQYKHVCPSYRLYLMDRNEVCERCLPGRFYHAALTRCHKGSLAASALVALESYIHKWLRVYDHVDVFHVPSRFLGEKLRAGGFAENKIWHAFYTINLEDYPFCAEAEDYFVYYGRLSAEKGIPTLLRAKKRLPHARLLIIGDGPMRPELERMAENELIENVEFLGNRGGRELVSIVQKARFVVVPSEWYDNSPLVIYESFSMGKPVIVSEMGGMPELIEHGVDGFRFPCGDVERLAELIATLWGDPDRCRKMGVNARRKAEQEFSPDVHYEKLMKVYGRLTEGAGVPV